MGFFWEESRVTGEVRIGLMLWAKHADDVGELMDAQRWLFRWVPAYGVTPGHKLQSLPSFSNFKISH